MSLQSARDDLVAAMDEILGIAHDPETPDEVYAVLTDSAAEVEEAIALADEARNLL